MADEQKQGNGNKKTSGGKRHSRRYFRRRRKSSGGDGQGSADKNKRQGGSPSDPQSSSGRTGKKSGDSRGKRRKRRRSSNRRSASSRRQRRRQRAASASPDVPELAHYEEPIDVFVHTHIVRPAYRDAGDYVTEASFGPRHRPVEASIHMEHLQNDIRTQLDEYFNRPVVPLKVTLEMDDGDWDGEEHAPPPDTSVHSP